MPTLKISDVFVFSSEFQTQIEKNQQQAEIVTEKGGTLTTKGFHIHKYSPLIDKIMQRQDRIQDEMKQGTEKGIKDTRISSTMWRSFYFSCFKSYWMYKVVHVCAYQLI